MVLGRKERLTLGLLAAAAILLIRLFSIQISDDKYKKESERNAMVYEDIFPTRGVIYDRNGRILVGNKVAYDILVSPKELNNLHYLDTVALANVLDTTVDFVRNRLKYYHTYRTKLGSQSQVMMKQISAETYTRFEEHAYMFPAFKGQMRSIRDYPFNAGGNLLGYVSEVDANDLKKHPGEYRSGDYIGKTGLEAAREEDLRGKKGCHIYLRDATNTVQAPYENGMYDQEAIPGNDIVTTIDAELQQYGQELMRNKVGSVVAIEPKTKAGQEKMGIALAKLAEEDPTFRTYTDEETGQTIIAGMGELHLEIIVDRLLREFKVEANVGAPQVAYKETVRKKINHETKYKRQSGGSGQYGHVKITVEPNESGKGYEFVNATVGGSIPKEYIPAVDAGIQGAMQSGILAGYPVVDVKVTLYDGSYHEVDSSEMAFKIAGSMAFKEAMAEADPVLLEPIMKVCAIVPDEYMGDVIGDLNSRRGQIQGYEMRSGAQQIDAFVPLSEMFGYATNLRSRTQGRGQYTMEPSHYVELPKGLQEKLINKRNGRENF